MTRLSWVALAAALALTAQAEWTLALAVGWHPYVAWCWPLAVDLYVLASFRAGRDRFWALALMGASVSGAHALPIAYAGGLPWLAAGLLSVVPVLVAWRVHEMRSVRQVPAELGAPLEETAPTVQPEPLADPAPAPTVVDEPVPPAPERPVPTDLGDRPRPDVSDLLLAGRASFSKLPRDGRTYAAFARQFKADGHKAGTDRLKELFRQVRQPAAA